MNKRKMKKSKQRTLKKLSVQKPKCGLCGKSGKLIKTECCDQWICDDEDQYVIFSYARNSCSRNHRRLTLCAYHFEEGHSGDWQECQNCRDSFDTETYVDYGTNEYNFVRLENPPVYEPKKCKDCGEIIILNQGGYSCKGNNYCCHKCTHAKYPEMFR